MKNKIIIALFVLIIIIGAVIINTNGINLSLDYGEAQKLNIQFTESFEIADVENILKEVIGDSIYKIDYIDDFKAGVTITTKSITDEQIDNFESKLKEKYQTLKNEEVSNEEGDIHTHDIIQVMEMPIANAFELIEIYITPFIITTVVSILFLGIIFRKAGILKVILQALGIIIGITLVYISAIAILRIPVSEYIIAIGVFVYGASVLLATLYAKSIKA